MKLGKSFLKTFSVVFVGLAMLMAPTTPAAFAGVEAGEGLTLDGSVRYRVETDSDNIIDKDRNRERVRLRFGGAYAANDMVSMGFRLETGARSIQSPYTTLGVADTAKNGEDFGLAQAFLVIKAAPATFLLGKWGSPLFNPAEFIHDADANFEGIGMAIGGGSDIKYTLLLARHFILDAGWNGSDWLGADDDAILTAQFIVSGGGDVSWTAAIGSNRVTLNTDLAGGILTKSQEHNWNQVVAEIRAKEMSDLRIGGGYQVYDGDAEWLDTADESGFVVYARVMAGPVGLRLYYWDVGLASQFLFGAAAQDNFPFSTNFTGFHAQLDLPKIHDAVSWDLRYYNQDTKNADYTDSSGFPVPGAVMTGDRNRTRIQTNLTVAF